MRKNAHRLVAGLVTLATASAAFTVAVEGPSFADAPAPSVDSGTTNPAETTHAGSTTGAAGNTEPATPASETTSTTTTSTTTSPTTSGAPVSVSGGTATSSRNAGTPPTESSAKSANTMASADPTTGDSTTVFWTGNGTSNGRCTSSEDLGLTVPRGQQAWLFILNSPGSGPFELTTNLGDATGTEEGNGSVHFILFTPLDAVLISASAVTGTGNSVLTVSGCQFAAPLTSTTISTTVMDATTDRPWTGDEAVGATAFDSSVVTPARAGSSTISGTVTYSFFSNGSCDGTGTPQTVTVRADGSVPTTPTTLPLAAGSYSYDAVYNGDGDFAASPVSSCEPFSVSKTTPTMTTVVFDATTAAPWTATEMAGSAAFDTSALSGTFSGLPPTGTVTYTFFQNGTCTAPGTDQTATIVSGAVPASSITAALPAGEYSFEAVFHGDGNYNASPVSPCEPFTVAPTTSGSTRTNSGSNGAAATSTSTTTPGGSPPSVQTAPSSVVRTAPAVGAPPSGIAFTGADLSTMGATAVALAGAARHSCSCRAGAATDGRRDWIGFAEGR